MTAVTCDGSAVCIAPMHLDYCRSQMTYAQLCAEEDEDAAWQATREDCVPQCLRLAAHGKDS